MFKKVLSILKKVSSAVLSGIIVSSFAASICVIPAAVADQNDSENLQSSNEKACVAAQLKNSDLKPSANNSAKICRVNKGHTDVFATYKDDSGNLVLGTRGDSFPGSDANGIRYNSSLVRFVVGKKSRERKNKVFSFVKQNVKYVYHLPSQMKEGRLYAGVSTETLGENSKIKSVTFSFVKANMPKNGAVYMAGKDDDKTLKHLGTDGTDFPSEYSVNGNAHVHMDWIFTAPGVYVLTVKAVAFTSDGNTLEDTQDYTFEVDLKRAKENSEYDFESSDNSDSDSDSDSGDSNANASENNNDENNNSESETEDEGSQDDSEDEQGSQDESEDESEDDSDSEDESIDDESGYFNNNEDRENRPVKAKCLTFKDIKHKLNALVISNGHADIASYTSNSGLSLAVQEDVTGQHVIRHPRTVVFYAGQSSKRNNVWRLPQTQKNGVPWVGFNNQNLSPHTSTTMYLAAIKGPGSVRVWLQGSLGERPSEMFSSKRGAKKWYKIPANTHMHANWDFSKAGYYTLTFAVKANGSISKEKFHFAIGVNPNKMPISCSVKGSLEEDEGEEELVKPLIANHEPENIVDDIRPVATFANSARNEHRVINARSGRSLGISSGRRLDKSLRSSSDKSKGLMPTVSLRKSDNKNAYNAKFEDESIDDTSNSGIIGFFKHKTLLAYSILSGSVIALCAVMYLGVYILRKYKIISLNSGFISMIFGN